MPGRYSKEAILMKRKVIEPILRNLYLYFSVKIGKTNPWGFFDGFRGTLRVIQPEPSGYGR